MSIRRRIALLPERLSFTISSSWTLHARRPRVSTTPPPLVKRTRGVTKHIQLIKTHIHWLTDSRCTYTRDRATRKRKAGMVEKTREYHEAERECRGKTIGKKPIVERRARKVSLQDCYPLFPQGITSSLVCTGKTGRLPSPPLRRDYVSGYSTYMYLSKEK